MVLDADWLETFCSLEVSRSDLIRQTLVGLGLRPSEIKTPPWQHWQSMAGLPTPGELVLVAHYDRQPGTPGANDNSASVFHLLKYLEHERGKKPFRVIFTDGEEVFDERQIAGQGSKLLGELWKSSQRIPRVLVFDMTGIGDTFVLGHLSQSLKQRAGVADDGATKALRLWTRRLLAGTDAGDFVEIDTPFSDDLGFLWAGIPAVQLSLLPRKQALIYQKQRREDALDQSLPPAWNTMHTQDDLPNLLWSKSFILFEKLLDRIGRLPYFPD